MMHEDYIGQKLCIYIGENDKYKGKLLYELLLEIALEGGLSGGTMTRGLGGFGSHGEIHSTKILRLAENLPLVLEFVGRKEKIDRYVHVIQPLIQEGLFTRNEVRITKFRSEAETETHDSSVEASNQPFEMGEDNFAEPSQEDLPPIDMLPEDSEIGEATDLDPFVEEESDTDVFMEDAPEDSATDDEGDLDSFIEEEPEITFPEDSLSNTELVDEEEDTTSTQEASPLDDFEEEEEEGEMLSLPDQSEIPEEPDPESVEAQDKKRSEEKHYISSEERATGPNILELLNRHHQLIEEKKQSELEANPELESDEPVEFNEDEEVLDSKIEQMLKRAQKASKFEADFGNKEPLIQMEKPSFEELEEFEPEPPEPKTSHEEMAPKIKIDPEASIPEDPVPSASDPEKESHDEGHTTDSLRSYFSTLIKGK